MNFKTALDNAKEKLDSYAQFAVDGITHICSSFGPRPCGGESERQAQEYLGETLKPFADTVDRETFDVHRDAFMSFVPIAGSLMLTSTAVNLVAAFKKNKLSLASFGLTAAAAAALVGEFGLYKQPLDPLFKKQTSGNVIAVRKAAGETKRRIILSGHTDSAPEWTYTYRLGSKGVLGVAGAAVAGLAYNVASTAVSVTSKNDKLKKGLALGQLAFAPAFGALYAFTNSRRYVDGANDDLSGCYVAGSVLKFLSDNDIRFENTEDIVLLTGGEECGLRGAKAFFAAHPEYGNDGVETVYVGFDTIRDGEYMEIYTNDLNGLVPTDQNACTLVQNAAAKCGKDVPFGSIPLGSTDAAAASQAGVPAAAFVAMDPAPARYYHTRLDTADILCPETIEKVIEIALQTVFDFDEEGLY